MKFTLSACAASAFLMCAGSALAQTDTMFFFDTTLSGPERYNRCLVLAQKEPQIAAEKAAAWRGRGGALYAAHCEAVALINLKRYVSAAQKLTNIANGKVDAAMRVQLYIQAANAWMMAEQPGNALPLLSDVLEISPGNLDALTDRARARAMRRDWAGAESDLSLALSKDPTRADLYVLRSSARHALGRKDEARADIDRALDLVPGYAEALVERGGLKLEAGDRVGAKADWEDVLKKSNGETAASARARLEALKANPAAK
ncbi:MAG TPA: tetratricopeptide repeat protein [Rhizomicrobium sp.]|nr:tetratricopeptide repeat protein [Rhizomicrobium sp.]